MYLYLLGKEEVGWLVRQMLLHSNATYNGVYFSTKWPSMFLRSE